MLTGVRWYLTVEYCATIKNNKIMSFAARYMELEAIILFFFFFETRSHSVTQAGVLCGDISAHRNLHLEA